MNVTFRTMQAGSTEERRAFKISVINRAEKTGTPKKLLENS